MGVTEYDADGNITNGVTPLSAMVYAWSSGGGAAAATGDFVAGQSKAFGFGFTSDFLYVDLSVVAAGATSDTYRFFCDGTIINLGGGHSSLSDGRLNRFYGDLINVLYRGTVGGMPAMLVYSLDADSNGLLAGAFTPEDIAPFVGAPPAENTAIRTIDRSTLYAITSGEFQINIGPDAENKVYTIIFNGLPVMSVYYP